MTDKTKNIISKVLTGVIVAGSIYILVRYVMILNAYEKTLNQSQANSLLASNLSDIDDLSSYGSDDGSGDLGLAVPDMNDTEDATIVDTTADDNTDNADTSFDPTDVTDDVQNEINDYV